MMSPCCGGPGMSHYLSLWVIALHPPQLACMNHASSLLCETCLLVTSHILNLVIHSQGIGSRRVNGWTSDLCLAFTLCCAGLQSLSLSFP
ncbi:hypothetical protein DENSPDRAFT_476266 [Dentipellis sp. KUC8613]|nr:hypothetical protein DENSPDRAFT_476266 [Dentipellis sp. KUC8613]